MVESTDVPMVTDAITVGVHYTVMVPADRVVELCGVDDGSDGWFDGACRAAGVWVRDNLGACLVDAIAPEVEVDGEFID